MLTRGGWDVWMVDNWIEHIAMIKRRGLLVLGDEADNPILMKGTERIGDLPPVDVALILVKTTYTEEVALELKKIMKKDGWVITLQTGLGHNDLLAGIVQKDHLLYGITSFGGKLTGAGEISITAYGQTLLTSSSDPRPKEVEEILNMFNSSSLNAQYLENMEGLRWQKLIVSAVIEPLTAILRIPNGSLFKSSYAMAMMNEIIGEALAIVEKKEIVIGREDFANHIKRIIKLTEHQNSAMLQDILNKQVTEINALNGAIVKEGESCGVPTPVNAVLTALVHSLEECALN